MREYFVIRPLKEGTKREWELLRYCQEGSLTGVNLVSRDKNGKFESNDEGFKRHKNENASKRIRILKKHLELGEPSHSCYWIEKGESQVSYFKA